MVRWSVGAGCMISGLSNVDNTHMVAISRCDQEGHMRSCSGGTRGKWRGGLLTINPVMYDDIDIACVGLGVVHLWGC